MTLTHSCLGMNSVLSRSNPTWFPVYPFISAYHAHKSKSSSLIVVIISALAQLKILVSVISSIFFVVLSLNLTQLKMAILHRLGYKIKLTKDFVHDITTRFKLT